MTGPDLDPRLSASMRRTILDYARKNPGTRRPWRRTVAAWGSIAVVAVAAGTAAVIVATGLPDHGSIPPVASTPTLGGATRTPTATAEPTPPPTPNVTATPPAAPTEAPSSEPSTEPTGPFVNGFDAPRAYQACIDATPPDSLAGFPSVPTPAEYTNDSVKAGADPYTRDGIPEEEWPSVVTVYVNWATGSTSVPNIVGICTVSGDPSDPTVTFDRTLD